RSTRRGARCTSSSPTSPRSLSSVSIAHPSRVVIICPKIARIGQFLTTRDKFTRTPPASGQSFPHSCGGRAKFDPSRPRRPPLHLVAGAFVVCGQGVALAVQLLAQRALDILGGIGTAGLQHGDDV